MQCRLLCIHLTKATSKDYKLLPVIKDLSVTTNKPRITGISPAASIPFVYQGSIQYIKSIDFMPIYPLLISTKASDCFCTYIFAPASNSSPHDTEYSPHSRLYIPFKISRAVQVISRTGGAVFQFHIKSVSNADCPF